MMYSGCVRRCDEMSLVGLYFLWQSYKSGSGNSDKEVSQLVSCRVGLCRIDSDRIGSDRVELDRVGWCRVGPGRSAFATQSFVAKSSKLAGNKN